MKFYQLILICLVIGACFFQSFAVTTTWTGSFDTDWHKDCNWDTGNLPTCSDAVVIPNVVNDPVISGVAHCASINIQSSSGAKLTIQSSSGGLLEIGTCPTAKTDNSGGGCCVTSTAVTSLTYSPNPTGSATSVTITASGGSLGTGASYRLYANSCGGTLVATNTTGSFTVGTNSSSVCPSKVYYVDIEGGTCDGNIACSPSLTVCATDGTVCSNSGPWCTVSSDPLAPDHPQCYWNNTTADGSCGTSINKSYSSFYACSSNPGGTYDACNCCCTPKGAVSSSSSCAADGKTLTITYNVTTTGYVLSRTYTSPGCFNSNWSLVYKTAGQSTQVVYTENCGVMCFSCCGGNPSGCYTGCGTSGAYETRTGTQLQNC